MEIKKLNNTNYLRTLNYTLKVLKQGGLVVFPSDTVYGLLVDAKNEQAVKKLIEFKNRPAGKPISVFVSDLEMMKKYVEFDKNNENIFKEILPGPYTIVLNSKHNTSLKLESEKGSLGVRIPKNKQIQILVKKFSGPVTATSANLSGRPPFYSIKRFLKETPLKKQSLINLIVDAGDLPNNKPSTVIDLTQPDIKILRKGDLEFVKTAKYISTSPEETQKIAGTVFDFSKSPDKALAFIIKGELGVGKTVFVKGIGARMGIKNIISPTFVIYYEYGNFYHFDLYQVQEKEEFQHLGLDRIINKGNIICFEWGEKAGEIMKLLKNKSKTVFINMKYINENKREIEVKY